MNCGDVCKELSSIKTIFDEKYEEDLNRIREQSNYDPTKYMKQDRLNYIPDYIEKENIVKDIKEEKNLNSLGQGVKSTDTNKTLIDGKILNKENDKIDTGDVLETHEYLIESKVVNFEDLDKLNLMTNTEDVNRNPEIPMIKAIDDNRVESVPCFVKKLTEDSEKRQI